MDEQVQRISWTRVFVGAVITLALSLSVHAVMLQGLHVPFPYGFPHTGWATLPDGLLATLGACFLSAHLPSSVRRRSLPLRSMLLFALLAMIREVLFRAPFMEYINLSNFTFYPFLDNAPRLVPWAVIAIGVELWTDRRRATWSTPLLALALAAFTFLIVVPAVSHAFVGVRAFTQAREGVQRYGLPYNWHILLPAYLTFLEPVASALAIGLLIRQQLPRKTAVRFGITAALILALKGPVFASFLYVFYTQMPAQTAMLSYGQFAFETMALAALTAATIQVALRPSTRAGAPGDQSMSKATP